MTEGKKKSGEISRREFLKDAGLLVGGTAIGSTVLLAACGGDGETATVTKTVTSTAAGGTATVTTTQQVGEVTKTVTGAGATSTVTESKFVCPIDNMEFDSLAELKAHFEAVHGGAPTPAALNVVKFTLNGDEYEIQVEPNETLRDLITEKLGYFSVKEMCLGVGACGSCTVIMNGRPVLSCLILAIECGGAVIWTSEGIARDPANRYLIDALVYNHTMQCGYCLPGYVCTEKALLDRNPKPTEEEIRDALGGNICRCQVYPKHILAIQEATGQPLSTAYKVVYGN